MEWIRMTFGPDPLVVETISGMLLKSWKTYEKYTAPLGLGFLSDSAHFVAPGGAHGILSLGCVPKLMDTFLEAGTAENLDGACVAEIARPAFFVSFAGPVP